MNNYLYKQAKRSSSDTFSAELTDGIIKGTLASVPNSLKREPTILDRMRLRRNQGLELALGNNGISSLKQDPRNGLDFEHSGWSRARQLGAIGLGTAGTAGGILAGTLLAKALGKKLGLDEDEYELDPRTRRLRKKKKSLLKQLGTYGLLGAGILGGGLAGANLGLYGAGFMNGLGSNTLNNKAIAGAALVASPREKRLYMLDAESKGIPRSVAKRNYNSMLKLFTPIQQW